MTRFRPAPGCSTSIEAHHAKHPWLGVEIAAPTSYADGGMRRDYQNGSIVWNPTEGCAFFMVHGFRATWLSTGISGHPYGYPVSDELWTDAGRAHQFFQKGSMWWDANLGLRGLTGPIALKHATLVRSVGYPKSDVTAVTGGWRVELENNATILHESGKPFAYELHGPIRTKYASMGWQTSYLRFPQSDVGCTEATRTCRATFNFGHISWYVPTNTLVDVKRNNTTPREPDPMPMPPPPAPVTVTDTAALALQGDSSFGIVT